MPKDKMIAQPIKRSEYLKPLSREHHHGLLVCWKIRMGLKKNVSINRIKAFTDWFYEYHLKEHFELEENYIFPILGMEHDLVKKAITEHKRLRRLFLDTSHIENSISLIEEELEKHIRFEERVLFMEIDKIASEQQLQKIEHIHNCLSLETNWKDEFWA